MASAASNNGEGVFGRGRGAGGCPSRPRIPHGHGGVAVDLRRDILLRLTFFRSIFCIEHIGSGSMATVTPAIRPEKYFCRGLFHKFDREAFLGHYKVHRSDMALPVLPRHKLG